MPSSCLTPWVLQTVTPSLCVGLCLTFNMPVTLNKERGVPLTDLQVGRGSSCLKGSSWRLAVGGMQESVEAESRE